VSAFRSRSVGKTAFVILLSSSERSLERWNRLSLVPPLMGFECRPPTGMPHLRPLPGAEAPFGPTLPRASSCSALVVSHHHNGLLRAEVTGLLHPATGQGFAAFHACRHRSTRRRASNGTIPATRFTPFEDFPSSAAVPHHCGPCLPAVTVLPGAGTDMSRFPCRTRTHRSGTRTPAWTLPGGRRPALPRGAGRPDSE
jgi:hypothetical protein